MEGMGILRWSVTGAVLLALGGGVHDLWGARAALVVVLLAVVLLVLYLLALRRASHGPSWSSGGADAGDLPPIFGTGPGLFGASDSDGGGGGGD